MAAGMHRAWVLRTVLLRALFGDAQGIHVGPERNRPFAIAAFERADDAGSADALGHLVEAELPQFGSHERTRALLLEAKLRMGMQVTPPAGHLLLKGIQIQGHGFFLMGL